MNFDPDITEFDAKLAAKAAIKGALRNSRIKFEMISTKESEAEPAGPVLESIISQRVESWMAWHGFRIVDLESELECSRNTKLKLHVHFCTQQNTNTNTNLKHKVVTNTKHKTCACT